MNITLVRVRQSFFSIYNMSASTYINLLKSLVMLVIIGYRFQVILLVYCYIHLPLVIVSIGVFADVLSLYLTNLILPDWYSVLYSVPYALPLLLIPLDEPRPPNISLLSELFLKSVYMYNVSLTLIRNAAVKHYR